MTSILKVIILVIALIVIPFAILYIHEGILDNYSFGKKLCKALSVARFAEYICYDKTCPEITNYKFYADIGNKIYEIVYWVNVKQIGIKEINTEKFIFINSYHTNKAIKILNERILLNNLSENGK